MILYCNALAPLHQPINPLHPDPPLNLLYPDAFLPSCPKPSKTSKRDIIDVFLMLVDYENQMLLVDSMIRALSKIMSIP